MDRLGQILERLNESSVEYVIVGGMAAVFHGVPLVTRDVDICLPFSEQNLLRLEKALKDLHPVHRQTPQRLPFSFQTDYPRGLQNLYLSTDWGVLDCLGEVAGLGDFSIVVSRSQWVRLPIGACRILDLEALIEAKQALDRPHDKQAVIHLREIQRMKKEKRD